MQGGANPNLQRAAQFASLAAGSLDALIIGGGIVGAGIARDAAMRGLKVGLVEQGDFASGTSSRSSRLLHGGIRYLSQGKLRLVREASLEKAILHSIAPHLVEPLAFIFPTYRKTDWPLWQLRIGVKFYDLLASGRNLGKSSALNRADLNERAPGLLETNRTGAVRYFDGFTQDARLVLDTLRSAQNHAATLLNYAKFEGVARVGREFVSRITDKVGGGAHEIRSRAVVNAAGPWAQGLGLSQVKLRLTKGIHVVFDRSRLPVQDAVVITEGARILFVIPWGERVIVGTTDTDYSGASESVASESADIEYLLQNANRFFPEAHLTPGNVISTWAGLRPLIADPHGRPSDISRAHQIISPEPGWWDVAGGKLTTYRLMAEQTIDQVVKFLGASANKCATATTPLLPAEETRGISQIIPPPFSRELVEHYCRNEWALTIEDVMIRRSSWHHYQRDRKKIAESAADCIARVLEWDSDQRNAQLDRYHELCEKDAIS